MEEGGGLWAAKILLLSILFIRVRKAQRFAYSQYAEMTCSVDMVKRALVCAGLTWSADIKVDLREGDIQVRQTDAI